MSSGSQQSIDRATTALPATPTLGSASRPATNRSARLRSRGLLAGYRHQTVEKDVVGPHSGERSNAIHHTRRFLARAVTTGLAYVELSKPRIAVMSLFIVVASFSLASSGVIYWAVLWHALLGIGLVACSSSALNQLLERRDDGLMPRTAGRPLPSGRVSEFNAAGFGTVTGSTGVVWLLLMVNSLTGVLALATLALYVFVYTPLKKRTFGGMCAGAIAGAMPPVLGWTAATGRLSVEAACLFAVLYVWQFPHFLAIGWRYRDEYRSVGMKMLPSGCRSTGTLATVFAFLLIPASVSPLLWGTVGQGYAFVALPFSLAYLLFTVRFSRAITREEETHEAFGRARQLVLFSLVYLPALLVGLLMSQLT